jgi:hypothetical protein
MHLINNHCITLAFQYDVYFTVSISQVDPLPLLIQAWIRFFITDDPGVPKTIKVPTSTGCVLHRTWQHLSAPNWPQICAWSHTLYQRRPPAERWFEIIDRRTGYTDI